MQFCSLLQLQFLLSPTKISKWLFKQRLNMYMIENVHFQSLKAYFCSDISNLYMLHKNNTVISMLSEFQSLLEWLMFIDDLNTALVSDKHE